MNPEMQYNIRLFLFCLTSLLPIIGITQNTVRFEASSDARQVVLGNTFTVDFTLYNGDGDDFVAPKMKDFEILSGPNPKSSVSIFNGSRSQSYALSYIIRPKKIGKFTIGAATVKVNGRTMRTKAFQVEVLKGKNSTAATRQELEKELREGIFIKAILNKEESKIGEQVIIDYKLYTSRNIESYNVFSESEYPGFFVHEIRRFSGRQVQEVIEGVQYTTKLLKKVALFPQQAGFFDIEPLGMNISIAVDGSRPRSIFSSPKVTTFRVMTDPIQIKVTPLPDPKPDSFTGAVGKFGMRSTVNRNKLTTDDAISLRMIIYGDGDIKQVQAPKLQLSETFDIYDPRIIEESNFEENSALKCKKEFVYQILPREPGDYTIQAAFTYFDSDSLDYITIRSDEFPVSVQKGELDRTQTIAVESAAVKNEDIRFIKMDASLSNDDCSFIGGGLFWGLFTLPFLLLGGVIVLRQIEISKGNIDATTLKRRRAVKIAQKRLSQAKGFMDSNNSKDFYDEVSRASFGYVCDKLNIPYAELTKENVSTKMQALNVTNNSIDKFMQIVKTCEMALFAGKDNAAAMKETYEQALEVIAEIEGQIVQE